MGRRAVSPDMHARWVFNRLAEHYRARPGYPDPLIDRLVALAGAAPSVESGSHVLELGAGTGAVALALARRGIRVAAVEPARAMLDVLEQDVRRENLPVTCVHAAAERTGLSGCFTLVLLADALHWVDPELTGAEVRRLLAPGGVLAIVQPAFAATPFMKRVQERLARENPKSRVQRTDDAQVFALAAPGGSVQEERFAHEVRLDQARLASVLRSISYVGPALGAERLEALLADVRAIAREEEAVWARVISLRWARRSN